MNATELLSEFGVPHKVFGEHTHTSRNFVSVDCPQCSPQSQHFRLGIPLSGKAATCWVCGRLDAWRVIPEITGITWKEWKARLGFFIPEEENTNRPRMTVLPIGWGRMMDVHRKYLVHRKFDVCEIERIWNVGGINGESARVLRWRLFIPVYQNCKLVNWTTRKLHNDGMRYRSCEDFQASTPIHNCLYGEDLAFGSVIVVEGPIDAWRIGPGAVATFGCAFTSAQVNRIAKFPRRCICFDNEPSAQRTAIELCRQLSAFPGETYRAELKSGKDPDTASPEELEELRKKFLC